MSRVYETIVLARKIKEFYATSGNETGGVLHIVLDDFNIDDEDIDWCLEQEGVDDAAKDIVGRLKTFDKSERMAIVSSGDWSGVDDDGEPVWGGAT